MDTITLGPLDAARTIRDALHRRGDRRWSVRNDRGTAYGWLTITAPPSRLDASGGMTDDDRAALSALLGVEVHHQGVSIAPGRAHYRWWIARAEGEAIGDGRPA